MNETTETTATTTTDDALALLHTDFVTCNSLLTALVAIVLAYTAAKVLMGWFRGD